MDKITQQKIKEAKELLEKYAPEGEFLAYINKKEANLLKAYGGSGNPTKETNIPSFLAPWVLPAIMAASTVVSFMGSLNNQRNIVAGMKANRNQIINKNNLDFARESKKGRMGRKEMLAKFGLSGTQVNTGSNLLVATNYIRDVEEKLDMIERNTIMELGVNDVRGAGLLAKEINAGTKTLLGGVAATGFAGYQSGMWGETDTSPGAGKDYTLPFNYDDIGYGLV